MGAARTVANLGEAGIFCRQSRYRLLDQPKKESENVSVFKLTNMRLNWTKRRVHILQFFPFSYSFNISFRYSKMINFKKIKVKYFDDLKNI